MTTTRERTYRVGIEDLTTRQVLSRIDSLRQQADEFRRQAGESGKTRWSKIRRERAAAMLEAAHRLEAMLR